MYVADLARSWGGAHLESRPWIIGIIKPCNMHITIVIQEFIDNIELYELKYRNETNEIYIIVKQIVRWL